MQENRDKPELSDREERLESLVQTALDMGATHARIIPADRIVVDPGLAEICKNPKCINYGLSKSCPPHVSGPEEFQRQLENFTCALVFKIEVPTEILYTTQNLELFQLLHEIAACVDQAAVNMGFSGARGYAGNSCKKLFCHDFLECRFLHKDGQCRNPDRARPSMSGFGVNVNKLYEAAGWQIKNLTRETGKGHVKMGSICGLVLIY
mgnify:CR=1 FL=1